MSYWFLPTVLSDEQRTAALEGNELALEAQGLADLSRAQGMDQVAQWLRHLHPDATPEFITERAEHFWRLGHELLPDDIIIVPTAAGPFMVGNISGAYNKASRAQGMSHVWPVSWYRSDIPATALGKLSSYAGRTALTEITDDTVLHALKTAVPSLRKGNANFFRWLGVAILIFELIYFWPKG